MVENGYNGRENIERYSRRRSRDIRFVPFEWNHPKDAEDNYLPLRRREPDDVGKKDGLMPDFSDVPDDQIGICAYNTTDNIPISTVYQDTPEGRLDLLEYCSVNKTIWSSYRGGCETWAGVLFSNRPFSIDCRTRRVEFIDETERS